LNVFLVIVMGIGLNVHADPPSYSACGEDGREVECIRLLTSSDEYADRYPDLYAKFLTVMGKAEKCPTVAAVRAYFTLSDIAYRYPELEDAFGDSVVRSFLYNPRCVLDVIESLSQPHLRNVSRFLAHPYIEDEEGTTKVRDLVAKHAGAAKYPKFREQYRAWLQ
jgi:hypothetical protein